MGGVMSVTDSAGWNRIAALEEQIESLMQQIADMNDYIASLEGQVVALNNLLSKP